MLELLQQIFYYHPFIALVEVCRTSLNYKSIFTKRLNKIAELQKIIQQLVEQNSILFRQLYCCRKQTTLVSDRLTCCCCCKLFIKHALMSELLMHKNKSAVGCCKNIRVENLYERTI